jgi:hypothetical protein
LKIIVYSFEKGLLMMMTTHPWSQCRKRSALIVENASAMELAAQTDAAAGKMMKSALKTAPAVLASVATDLMNWR